MLNTVPDIIGSKMDSILYSWKLNGKYSVSIYPLYKPQGSLHHILAYSSFSDTLPMSEHQLNNYHVGLDKHKDMTNMCLTISLNICFVCSKELRW